MNFKWLNFTSIILAVVCVLGRSNLAHADFDAFEKARPSLLTDQSFQDLKNKVLDYLENSWCSKEKASLLMDLVRVEKLNACVEIGVFTGSSMLPVAAALKYNGKGNIFAIDAWSNEEAIKDMSKSDPNRDWWSQVDMKEVYRIFTQMNKNWKLDPYIQVLRRTSENAVAKIGMVDFIHFDGNYSEKSSLKDVAIYLPKLKEGGYVLISNVLLAIDGTYPKMEALFALFEDCEIVAEIEDGNAYLLQKRSQ